jgi:O-methyltransferase
MTASTMTVASGLRDYPDIVEPDFHLHYRLCQPHTMTQPERLYALFNAVRYVVAAGVPGAFAECGVWKGGSVMMMALVLKSLDVTDRDIYLFDTFEGMTAPTDRDVDWRGVPPAQQLAEGDRARNDAWAWAPLDDVRRNLQLTGYPMERFVFVRGDVRQTLPGRAPDRLALLRLDTDWYESTRHELEQLFPRLQPRGVLIVDDYGHFAGARQAVDEYLSDCPEAYLMHRVDYTARLLVKA